MSEPTGIPSPILLREPAHLPHAVTPDAVGGVQGGVCTPSCGLGAWHREAGGRGRRRAWLHLRANKRDPLAPHQGPGSVPSAATSQACECGQGPQLRLGLSFHICKLGTNALLPGLSATSQLCCAFLRSSSPPFFSTGPSRRSPQSPRDPVPDQCQAGKGRRQVPRPQVVWRGLWVAVSPDH